MKPQALTKILGLLLSASLALPQSAWALRQQSADSVKVEAGLEEALEFTPAGLEEALTLDEFWRQQYLYEGKWLFHELFLDVAWNDIVNHNWVKSITWFSSEPARAWTRGNYNVRGIVRKKRGPKVVPKALLVFDFEKMKRFGAQGTPIGKTTTIAWVPYAALVDSADDLPPIRDPKERNPMGKRELTVALLDLARNDARFPIEESAIEAALADPPPRQPPGAAGQEEVKRETLIRELRTRNVTLQPGEPKQIYDAISARGLGAVSAVRTAMAWKKHGQPLEVAVDVAYLSLLNRGKGGGSGLGGFFEGHTVRAVVRWRNRLIEMGVASAEEPVAARQALERLLNLYGGYVDMPLLFRALKRMGSLETLERVLTVIRTEFVRSGDRRGPKQPYRADRTPLIKVLEADGIKSFSDEEVRAVLRWRPAGGQEEVAVLDAPSLDRLAQLHIVAVAVHPDDLEGAQAGLLQELAQRGARIDLVFLTTGAGVTPDGLEIGVRSEEARVLLDLDDDAPVSTDAMVELRQGEAKEGAQRMGLNPENIRFFAFGAGDNRTEDLTETLGQAAQEELLAHLIALTRDEPSGPGNSLTVLFPGEGWGFQHPAHLQAAVLMRETLQTYADQVQRPVDWWVGTLASDDPRVSVLLPVSGEAEQRKLEALDAHQTQHLRDQARQHASADHQTLLDKVRALDTVGETAVDQQLPSGPHAERFGIETFHPSGVAGGPGVLEDGLEESFDLASNGVDYRTKAAVEVRGADANPVIRLPNGAVIATEGGGAVIYIAPDVLIEQARIVAPPDATIEIGTGAHIEDDVRIIAPHGKKIAVGTDSHLLAGTQLVGNVEIGQNTQIDAVVSGDTVIGDGTFFERGSGTHVDQSVLVPFAVQVRDTGRAETRIVPVKVNQAAAINNSVVIGGMMFQGVKVINSILGPVSLMGNDTMISRSALYGISGGNRVALAHHNDLISVYAIPALSRRDLTQPAEREALQRELLALRVGVLVGREIADPVQEAHAAFPTERLRFELDDEEVTADYRPSNFGASAGNSNFDPRNDGIKAPTIIWGGGMFGVKATIGAPAEVGPNVLVANNAVVSGQQALESGTLVLPQGAASVGAVKPGYLDATRGRLGRGVANNMAIRMQAIGFLEVLVNVAVASVQHAQSDAERAGYLKEAQLLQSYLHEAVDDMRSYLALVSTSVTRLASDALGGAGKGALQAKLREQRAVLRTSYKKPAADAARRVDLALKQLPAGMEEIPAVTVLDQAAVSLLGEAGVSFWDLDGTLWNYPHPVEEAFLIGRFGVPVFEQERFVTLVRNHTMGLTWDETVDEIHALAREEGASWLLTPADYTYEQFQADYNPGLTAHVRARVQTDGNAFLVPGGVELLKRLALPHIILTGGDADSRNQITALLGINIGSGELVEALHGDGEKAEKIARILQERGLQPQNALIWGDSDHDIQAGLDAGVVTVAYAATEEAYWHFMNAERDSRPVPHAIVYQDFTAIDGIADALHLPLVVPLTQDRYAHHRTVLRRLWRQNNRADEAILAAVDAQFPLRDPTYSFLALKNGEAMGGVLGFWDHAEGDAVYMYNLTVAPSHQRSGIGRELVLAAEAAARESSANRALLYVERDSEVQGVGAFYLKLGYERVGRFSDSDPAPANLIGYEKHLKTLEGVVVPTASEVRIRPLQDPLFRARRPRIKELLRQLEGAGQRDSHEVLDNPELRDSELSFLALGKSNVPVGIVFGIWDEGEQDTVFLYDLVVDKPQRRRGIGRALVEEVLKAAKAKGARGVVLDVQRDNQDAIRTYEALQFKRGAAFVSNGGKLLVRYEKSFSGQEEATVSPQEIPVLLRRALPQGYVPSNQQTGLVHIFDPEVAHLGRLTAELIKGDPVVLIAEDEDQETALIQSGFGGVIVRMDRFDDNIASAQHAAAIMYEHFFGLERLPEYRHYTADDQEDLLAQINDLLGHYDIPASMLPRFQAERLLKALEILRAA